MVATRERAEPARTTKDFPVFDCDAHVQDPEEIWNFVDSKDWDAVKRSYWKDSRRAVLNGQWQVSGAGQHQYEEHGFYHPGSIAGPGMNKRVMRKLQRMVPLTMEQMDYLNHKGSYYPEPRLRDMDLMGIDQVLIVPTTMLVHLPYVKDIDGARAFARAYNNWLVDYCKAAPERLFGAGVLPLQNAFHATEELKRVKDLKFPVALVRPFDAHGRYPNHLFFDISKPSGRRPTLDGLFKTFEETRVMLGLHTFTMFGEEPRTTLDAPGELVMKTGQDTGRFVDPQTMSFVFEAMTWLSQVLLSGFLDRYPKLKMGIFESNATWMPQLLERCDRLFKLYKNERRQKATRLPSEAFYDQCILAFEGDEELVFRRWNIYENIGIWSSDAYHHDGADAWQAMRAMEKAEVPHPVQAKLLGGNARRMYGIEGKTFVTQEPPPLERPAWFPKEDEAFEKWWEAEANPRKHGRTPATHCHTAAQRTY